MEALNNNRIGLCKWIESGTTLDTAVPELCELTNDKEDWKAIIVRFEDDHAMSRFDSDEQNPYDFPAAAVEEYCAESDIPLIRLTQMLGGVPAPEIKFECERIISEGEPPRTIYKPVVDEKQNKAYKELCRKYEFNGKMPSSIIIISIREGFCGSDGIGGAWESHKESKSSGFWKRNRYPSNCRFLVYDFEKKGPVQRNADEFGFWMTVMLLAANRTEPSSLQAYRLYNARTDFSRSHMTESFQQVVSRLRSAKYVIEKEIRKDIESQLVFEETLPKYKLEVPVPIKTPKVKECSVETKGFGLLSKGARSDVGMWNTRKKEAEEKLGGSVRGAERTLDQAASRMREFCSYTEEEVSGLNKYQTEDLMRETDEIYKEIVEIQGILPNDEVESNTDMTSAAKNVHDYLKGRVTAKNASLTLLIVLVLIALSQIPAIADLIINGSGTVTLIAVSAGIEFLIAALFGFGALVFQYFKLRRLLKKYNSEIRSEFNGLTENASEYSRYLSNIASHCRGRSYLNISARKKHLIENAHRSKYKHIKAIEIFLAKLRMWSTAYRLKVDFDDKLIDEHMTVDIMTLPSQNTMYTFETGGSYPVTLNSSGMTVDSPFSFIDRLVITREELYDDNEHC